MKKTIFFDLGNVLIFFDHNIMCKQVAEVTGSDLGEVEKLMQQYIDPYERGEISSEELHHQVSQTLAKKPDYNHFIQALSTIFTPNPQAIEIALELKAQGHSLFLLSNTCEAHFDYALTQFDFLNAFDGFVLSYEVKARKPEKQIFEKALKLGHCSPQESFYTDDILEYVQSAKELDIDAQQFLNPSDLREQLTQRGLLS